MTESDDTSRSSPHDRLVRHVLAIPENARGELRAALPAGLVDQIDWDTLRVENGAFADQRGESRTDLLFSVELGGRTAHIYVLFEHQSSSEPDMALRMLVYMARIWEWARGQRGAKAPLPVIVPVVLSHAARGWTGARALGELLDWDDALRELLGAHVPDYRLVIDDLVAAPEIELLRRDATPLTRLIVWVLRGVRVGIDEDLIEEWAGQLNDAYASASREALAHLLKYLAGTDEGTVILQALRRAHLSEGVGTMIGGLHRELLEQGRVEGRVEGRAEGLLVMLEHRFGHLPAGTAERVRGASVEQLDRWAKRLLDAESLDEVFG